MGNRAILSSSLLPFHNGKIVTLECACFATEDLPSLESKMIFFWDSTRVNWRMLFFLFLCSIFLYVSPTSLLYLFFFYFFFFCCHHPVPASILISEHFPDSFVCVLTTHHILLVKSGLAQSSSLKPYRPPIRLVYNEQNSRCLRKTDSQLFFSPLSTSSAS